MHVDGVGGVPPELSFCVFVLPVPLTVGIAAYGAVRLLYAGCKRKVEVLAADFVGLLAFGVPS
jgi:hypothetical protein